MQQAFSKLQVHYYYKLLLVLKIARLGSMDSFTEICSVFKSVFLQLVREVLKDYLAPAIGQTGLGSQAVFHHHAVLEKHVPSLGFSTSGWSKFSPLCRPRQGICLTLQDIEKREMHLSGIMYSPMQMSGKGCPLPHS